MVRRTLVALATAAALAAPAVATAQTSELKFLSGFDTRFPVWQTVNVKYTDEVKAASNGRISFRLSGPEVVPPFEQFQPLTSGAFDILLTVQPYHLGTTSVSMGMYALRADPEGWRKNGVFEFIDKEYQRHGARLLAVIPGTRPDVGGYQVLLKGPLPPTGDLKGLKVRGNPLYKAMIDELGASMVTLAGGEIYSALQKGVVEGVFWPVLGAVDLKWYEVSKHMLRPTWGSVLYFLLANNDKFNKMSPADREILLKQGAAIELTGMDAMDKLTAAEIEELKKRGLTEIQGNPERMKKAIDIFTEGLWQQALGSKATAEQAKAFREFVTQRGIK
ncbi:MAG: hypothetical protein FJX67_10685 [Alphaproteobacteria bacterium]|nr:hypothetical protein [Alphaproteobacteria bacterium]